MAALLSVVAIASNESIASMSDSTVTTKVGTRLSKRVDAISTGNYGGHLPGALTVLSSTLSAELEMAVRAPYNAGPEGLGRFTPTTPFETDIVIQRGTADDACRVIYRSDFDSPVQDTLRNEWSYGDVRETPQGRRFLGTIGNGSTTLTVAQAPKNGDYVIQFDVLAIGGWQGNKTSTGLPEVWGVRVVDGPTLAETNFATTPGKTQAYPDAVGRSNFEAGYQAIETFTTADGKLATVYRLTYRFNRAAEATATGTDDVRIEFFARGLSAKEAPSWGLTNVVLALVPDSGGKGGGAGTGTGQYRGNGDNGFIAAYEPNGFGLLPAGGSDGPGGDNDPNREVPAPGSVLVLAAAGLLGVKRRR